MVDLASLTKLAEGKTKVIYTNPSDPATVFMLFKDDITAGDGIQHDVLEGKAALDWRTNRDIFELLNRAGIPTHYVASPEERITLVRRLERKINLEVVSRRIAAGSIVKWGGIEEGTRLDPPSTQFHYKDDPIHDPMLDDGYIEFLVRNKGAAEYDEMRRINEMVLLLLERAFADSGVQLLDLKLEYGIIEEQVLVIDEISGGSLRLWPYRTDNPDLTKPNILDELDPGGKLDKDTYREGGPMDAVLGGFRSIAAITAGFNALPLDELMS
jgi:phosphoribosylaminoimidazole-succinocarboxamide synthase